MTLTIYMTTNTNTVTESIGTDPLTDRVRATWTAGDFGRIAKGYERGAGEFIARLGLESGESVLDVACGTGNLALPAARVGASVTGIDIAPNLIAQAKMRAAAEGLFITFETGDAERLPYEDGAFETVVTMFGAMFAARPERSAAELLRVTRAGGRIAMANWTPTGFIGEMLKATVRYVPAPAGIPSPLQWGVEDQVKARLGSRTASLKFARRLMTFEYPFGPEEVVSQFRLWYGPTLRAFAALDEPAREALRRDLEDLWSEHNRAVDGTTYVQSEYLEVIAVVK
ncbi:MAG TPA: methyltransferase domain-containing protein [Gemmatimonadaceae bacterium]